MAPPDLKDADRTLTVGDRVRSAESEVPLAEQAAAASTGAGKRLGRFELRERLGQGGGGVVYRATDKVLSRDVALKILNPGTASPERRLRLQREAQVMAALSHPNLVTVYDVGVDGDELFITMEYVRGTNVSAWLATERRAWPEIMRVFVAAGRGLEAAHAAGVVHRDFKPSNVLISNSGSVQVADFGVATTVVEGGDAAHTGEVQLTKTGVALGTPKYMSPEQHQALPLDARSDQFSFAVALAEAVYGEHPFDAASYRELVHEVLDGEPKLPAERGPEGLAPLLRRALARNPVDRYPSMTVLLGELETLSNSGGRRPRWPIAAAITAVVSAGIATAVVLGSRAPIDPAVARAVDTEPTSAVAISQSTAAAAATVGAIDAGIVKPVERVDVDAAVVRVTAKDAPPVATKPVTHRSPARVRVVRRTPRRRPRPAPKPTDDIAETDSAPPRLVDPPPRVGRLVYRNQRCPVQHDTKSCGVCCDNKDDAVMPYPNCGCYYDAQALAAKAAIEGWRRASVPSRLGGWTYRSRCGFRADEYGICRNCCRPGEKFTPYPQCACYENTGSSSP